MGKPVSYAIEGSPLNTLSELPVKLNGVVQITDETNRNLPYPRPVIIEAEKKFRLSDILYGIFWELSFLGGPDDRDEFNEELNRRIEESVSGAAKTYSWEEVKERITKKLEEE